VCAFVLGWIDVGVGRLIGLIMRFIQVRTKLTAKTGRYSVRLKTYYATSAIVPVAIATFNQELAFGD